MDGNQRGHFGKDVVQSVAVADQHVARRRAEKEFHSRRVAVVHRHQRFQIVVGRADKESVVCHRHLLRSSVFSLESVDGDCRRHGVGHIHVRSHAASHRRRRLGCDVGFMCESGVAEVHLVVDYARHHQRSVDVVAHVAFSHHRRCRLAFAHFGDYFVVDNDVSARQTSFVGDVGIVDYCLHKLLMLGELRVFLKPAADAQLQHAEHRFSEDAAVHLARSEHTVHEDASALP